MDSYQNPFALTAANIADGFATARDSHVGIEEAPFPEFV